MKIAFLTKFNVGVESGVLKKIALQLKLWRSFGADARLFALAPTDRVWSGLDGVPVVVSSADVDGDARVVSKFRHRFSGMAKLMRRLDEFAPDVVFWRYTTYYPAVAKMMRRYPTVLEINTDDLEEYRLRFSALANWYHRALRGRVLRPARGMIFVTDELRSRFDAFDAEKIVVPNSIDLSEFSPPPPPNNDRPRLLFVAAAGRAWHGFDKVFRLAARFPDWRFDVVGPERSDFDDVPPNVTVRGKLTREEYEPTVAETDVALGTLSLHRKGLEEACPLKVREYLAYGLPTVVGYRDVDFDDEDDFVLRIPNVERNVEEAADEIAAFVERWKGTRVDRERVRRIDATEKERRKYDFLAEVVRQSSDASRV